MVIFLLEFGQLFLVDAVEIYTVVFTLNKTSDPFINTI